MNETQTLHTIVQQQERQIAELRLEIESLKRMMFEHRPAFVAAFEASKERVKRGETLTMAAAVTQHNCG